MTGEARIVRAIVLWRPRFESPRCAVDVYDDGFHGPAPGGPRSTYERQPLDDLS